MISTRVYIPQNKIHKYQRHISVEYQKKYAWVLILNQFKADPQTENPGKAGPGSPFGKRMAGDGT